MSTENEVEADGRGEHVTIGDLDIDVEDEALDDVPIEVGTRADGVVLAPERKLNLPEQISIEGIRTFICALGQACDVAAQFDGADQEQEQEQEQRGGR